MLLGSIKGLVDSLEEEGMTSRQYDSLIEIVSLVMGERSAQVLGFHTYKCVHHHYLKNNTDALVVWYKMLEATNV